MQSGRYVEILVYRAVREFDFQRFTTGIVADGRDVAGGNRVSKHVSSYCSSSLMGIRSIAMFRTTAVVRCARHDATMRS